jgi:hypothetical protein
LVEIDRRLLVPVHQRLNRIRLVSATGVVAAAVVQREQLADRSTAPVSAIGEDEDKRLRAVSRTDGQHTRWNHHIILIRREEMPLVRSGCAISASVTEVKRAIVQTKDEHLCAAMRASECEQVGAGAGGCGAARVATAVSAMCQSTLVAAAAMMMMTTERRYFLSPPISGHVHATQRVLARTRMRRLVLTMCAWLNLII